MIYLLILNSADFISGILKGIALGDISSKKLKKGIIGKLLQWIVIAVTITMKPVIHVDLLTYVIMYYYIMEVISILENVAWYLPVPKKLLNVLAQFKEIENEVKSNEQD